MNGLRDHRKRTDRDPVARAVRWCFVLLVVLAAGCELDLPGKPRASDRPLRADQVVDFAALYRQNCAGCHGADGTLGPAPPLNDPVFLSIVPDEVVFGVINEGRPGTPMPAFARDHGGPLTDAQVKVLAEGVKRRWKPAQPSPGDWPRYSVAEEGSGEARSGDVERGGKVFARACAGCHGAHGEGAEDMDEGAGAINDAAFLALISDQALRRYAITGRPDLGMPNSAAKAGRPKDFQPLTTAEIDDLVAFLARWRQDGPAGDH